MSPEAQKKAAFVVSGYGVHVPVTLPFGLTRAPASYQRLMEQILPIAKGGEIYASTKSVCMAYLDDIGVPSKGIDQGWDHLDIILETIEKENLKLHPKKCSLLKKELQFFGNIVSKVRTDPQKLDKVLNWPRPYRITQVKGFLGLCEYYANFCPNFVALADPLYRLREIRGQNVPVDERS